jgi:hypothetical protein
VYVAPLENLTAWTRLETFDDYSSADTSQLPYQTEYPTHYFFNASGTQAVSVKRTAIAEVGNSDNHNPLRMVTLDVSASLGQTDFDLESAESIDMTGSEVYSGDHHNHSMTYNLHYTAHRVAADYLGDQLVELHLRVDEYAHSHGSVTGDWISDSSTYTEDRTHTTSLQTSTDWEWETREEQSSYFSTKERVDEERTALDFHESHSQSMARGIEYIDLRFDPPLVAYEERQESAEEVHETFEDESGVYHIVQDSRTEERKEKLAWRIADAVHNVWGFADVTDESLFRLPLSSGVFFWGVKIPGEWGEIGTFAVGGSSGNPQVIGVHKNLQSEKNFMYPAGDLGAFGGGPVGY